MFRTTAGSIFTAYLGEEFVDAGVEKHKCRGGYDVRFNKVYFNEKVV